MRATQNRRGFVLSGAVLPIAFLAACDGVPDHGEARGARLDEVGHGAFI